MKVRYLHKALLVILAHLTFLLLIRVLADASSCEQINDALGSVCKSWSIRRVRFVAERSMRAVQWSFLLNLCNSALRFQVVEPKTGEAITMLYDYPREIRIPEQAKQ